MSLLGGVNYGRRGRKHGSTFCERRGEVQPFRRGKGGVNLNVKLNETNSAGLDGPDMIDNQYLFLFFVSVGFRLGFKMVVKSLVRLNVLAFYHR